MQCHVWKRERISFFACMAVCLAAGFLLLSGAAQAQVLYGSLTGNVVDPSGAAVPGATVEALNIATGATRQMVSDERGAYTFTSLQPGIYKVSVTAQGFSPHVTDNVLISANSLRRNDVQLKLGQMSEQVTVEAGVAVLQTDRADVNTQLEATQIANLPITSSAGRSYQALYKIIPGFSVPTERNSGGGNPQRSMTSNVNGLSSQGNSTRIDGASNAYIWLPANVAYVPPADAIENVNVVTNSYDAEQGTLGAAINLQIKT